MDVPRGRAVKLPRILLAACDTGRELTLTDRIVHSSDLRATAFSGGKVHDF